MVPRGLMSWPGVAQIERGSFTFTQGINPSVATIEILPQDPSTIPLDGTLTITFGDVQLDFPDSRIDVASFDYSPQGLIWRLNIYDRRWKWKFAGAYGPVSGWWNQRFAAIQPAPQDWQLGYVQLGSVNPDTLQTPQQMAEMLLAAMGEASWDVSALPNNSLPEAVWDNDNPAQLLQDLCESLGSRVVLGLDNMVRIVQHGVGSDLPAGGVEHESDVVDPPEIPDSILVVGGRTRYQVDFLLEAVGLDVDGVVKPIGQLSYAPNPKDPTTLGGFGSILSLDPEVGFGEIDGWEQLDILPENTPPRIAKAYLLGGTSNQVNPRYLARQTVWRWWRISVENGSADNSKKPPLIPGWGLPLGGSPPAPPDPPKGGKGKRKQAAANKKQKLPPIDPNEQWGTRLTALWQILPIEDVQVLGWYDNANNFVPYDATAYGRYVYPAWNTLQIAGATNQDAVNNFTSNTAVACEYQIDRERGIIMFEEPIYFYKVENNTIVQPFLYLRCTVSVRSFNSSAPERFYLLRDLGGGRGTGPRVIKREEIVRQIVPEYDAKFNVKSLFTNDEGIVQEANYAIDAALLEYQTKQPQDVTYMGIVPIAVDGTIQQVTWSVGPQGATTRAARDTEVFFHVPSYRERTLMNSLRDMTPAVRGLQAQTRKK